MNMRRLEREDMGALAMNAIELDKHLAERRELIEKQDKEIDELRKAIDSINTLSGRASTGHDEGCECSYCLIHRVAFKAWQAR